MEQTLTQIAAGLSIAGVAGLVGAFIRLKDKVADLRVEMAKEYASATWASEVKDALKEIKDDLHKLDNRMAAAGFSGDEIGARSRVG